MITEYHNQFLQETAAHMDLPLLSERPANQRPANQTPENCKPSVQKFGEEKKAFFF